MVVYNGKETSLNKVIKLEGISKPSEFKKAAKDAEDIHEVIKAFKAGKTTENQPKKTVKAEARKVEEPKAEVEQQEEKTPVKRTRRSQTFKIGEFEGTVREIADHFDLSYSALRRRLVINEEDPETVIKEMQE